MLQAAAVKSLHQWALPHHWSHTAGRAGWGESTPRSSERRCAPLPVSRTSEGKKQQKEFDDLRRVCFLFFVFFTLKPLGSNQKSHLTGCDVFRQPFVSNGFHYGHVLMVPPVCQFNKYIANNHSDGATPQSNQLVCGIYKNITEHHQSTQCLVCWRSPGYFSANAPASSAVCFALCAFE